MGRRASVVALAVLAATGVDAQGFTLNEVGTCAVSRTYSTTR